MHLVITRRREKKRHKRNTFAYAVYFAVVISATHVRYRNAIFKGIIIAVGVTVKETVFTQLPNGFYAIAVRAYEFIRENRVCINAESGAITMRLCVTGNGSAISFIKYFVPRASKLAQKRYQILFHL